MNKTIEYYNKNADEFVQGTLSVDFVSTQERFLEKLPVEAHILDFGCGSGRDTKYFLDKGYTVEATDGSMELCKIASEYTGIYVRQMLFEELDKSEKYDGIWACSSILHLNKSALKDVLKKMSTALKGNGIIYTSFKYGDFEGERNGRYFTDFTIEAFKEYICEVPELQIEEYWITGDVRPGRSEEKWLNLILRKMTRWKLFMTIFVRKIHRMENLTISFLFKNNYNYSCKKKQFAKHMNKTKVQTE